MELHLVVGCQEKFLGEANHPIYITISKDSSNPTFPWFPRDAQSVITQLRASHVSSDRELNDMVKGWVMGDPIVF